MQTRFNVLLNLKDNQIDIGKGHHNLYTFFKDLETKVRTIINDSHNSIDNIKEMEFMKGRIAELEAQKHNRSQEDMDLNG